MQVDLDAYLDRIHLKARPDADADGLARVQRHHRLTIPFEDLDIHLGRGIDLSPDALFDKLVVRRRGGYCFEQNALFLLALERLGFDARPLLARVWLGASETPPRTHTLSLVTLGGEEWIADPGFGASYAPPMKLTEHEVASPDGSRFRLRRDDLHGWMLERLGDPALTDGRGAGHAGWLPQYSFTTDQVWLSDLDLSNHWTATAPASRFVQNVIVSLVLPSGLASLTGTHYSRRNGAEHVAAEIGSAKAWRLRAQFVFGLDLAQHEVDALGLYP